MSLIVRFLVFVKLGLGLVLVGTPFAADIYANPSSLSKAPSAPEGLFT